jgi:hypothetical protein
VLQPPGSRLRTAAIWFPFPLAGIAQIKLNAGIFRTWNHLVSISSGAMYLWK